MKTQNLQKIVLTAAAFVLFTTAGFTNAQSKTVKTNTVKRGALYIDANGDGICDNFAKRQKNVTANKNGSGKGMAMRKGNGTGICNGNGQGRANGGGVCDGTGPKGRGGK